MPETLRVLCVHGVNTPETNKAWQEDWRKAIRDGVQRWSPKQQIQVEFLGYNELFAAEKLTATDYVVALGKLLASGVSTAIGSAIGALTPKTRGFSDVSYAVRWTAGMVVQWSENDALRARTREQVMKAVEEYDPSVVLAHSLGSLLCYDTFIHDPGRNRIRERTFVSFGSQIGNPFVRNCLGGRLNPLRARFWYHLFNRHDLETFTWPIKIADPAFAQVKADFDLAGLLDHDAGCYLRHPGMVDTVWREILASSSGKKSFGATGPAVLRNARSSNVRPPRTDKRALLIGINEYPNPTDRLEGCVNDVFLMSSLLQECAFDAEDIRVVLDERATAKTITDRLDWLLEDVQEGDQRVFFYSGHGAQLPAYAPDERVDHKEECLVPYDFDWSVEHAVTDNTFFDMYSQIPYGAQVVFVFDCCHSGGLTRDGGAKIRGLTPPDDVRHRDMKWNLERQMWVSREFKPRNISLSQSKEKVQYLGESGVKQRLGRAVKLRRLENRDYDRVRKELRHKGPYLPLILEACGEMELASEYRHGVTSYGAFTYSLAKILRSQRAQGTNLNFEALVARVGEELQFLKYDQEPQIVGPKKVRRALIPWLHAEGDRQAGRRAAPPKKRGRAKTKKNR